MIGATAGGPGPFDEFKIGPAFIETALLLTSMERDDQMRVNLIRLSLFWHFLDIIWIGIFSIVYLQGLIPGLPQ